MKPTSYKIFSRAILTSLLLPLASGCAEYSLKDEPGGNAGDIPLNLGAAYPVATKATDLGFEDGDEMGVYVLDYEDGTRQEINASSIHAANICFRYSQQSDSWTGSSTLYWTSADTPADIIAYYPYTAGIANGKELAFSVDKRQDSAGEGIEKGGYEKSDFLWAKSGKTMPTEACVNLTFGHVLAAVRVTLLEGSGFASGEWSELEKSVLVSNTSPNARIDLSDGSVAVTEASPVNILPFKHNDDWRAVVVPQTVGAGKDLLVIEVGNSLYRMKKDAVFTYSQGKMHPFTITVNKKSSGGDYEFTVKDEAVVPWVDDAEFRDGVMREYISMEVPSPGMLERTMKEAGINLNSPLSLKLNGELNGDDYRFLRENCKFLIAVNLKDSRCIENGKNVIPDQAFSGVNTLSHVVFPDKLQAINNEAFRECGLYGSIIIPEGVEDIGYAGFQSCNFSGTVTLPSTLKTLGNATFAFNCLGGELHLPDGLTSIGGDAFRECSFSGELRLPESLEEVYEAAFEGSHFTGDLVIPQNLKNIAQRAFAGATFSGMLVLPEGLREIPDQAFRGCQLRGELKLPSTLKRIGNNSFEDNKFSNIVFPKGLSIMGKGCFAGNGRLSGTLTIPEKLTAINENAFADCTLLDEVIVGEEVSKIEGGAFRNCYNLSSVVVNNHEPPLLTFQPQSPFAGVPMDNFTLQVPAESVETYRSSHGWKEFKRIAAYSNFVCRPATACALTSQHSETLVLNSDGDWRITHIPSWCKVSKSSGTGKTSIDLVIDGMQKGSGDRKDYIEFALNGTEFITRCEISQFDYEYAEDQCITLQTASKGNGVDLVFLGDGFDASAIAEGKYLDLVGRQMEAFFGVEPFASYRDYFNVYACVSLSQESGVNTASTWRNTRFSTLYSVDCSGTGNLMHEDMDMVLDYVADKTPLTRDELRSAQIIMALNSDEYGGSTTNTWWGASVSICCDSSDPYPSDMRGIVQHEACGHGFGRLADEKISWNRYLKEAEAKAILACQASGAYRNISVSGKMADVCWSHFIFDPRYSVAVDIFEGAYGVTRGVYRSELNSCMNAGIPYFNAISRQEIVRRILDISGEGFSTEKFYSKDSDKWGSTGSTRAVMPEDHNGYCNSTHHHPVRYIKSKKY